MSGPHPVEGALLNRVRCLPGSDPLVARLRLSTALGNADWSVPGLPSPAILCARTLRAPAPGRSGGPDPAWQQRLTSELRRLAAAAGWPARGAVPAEAPAVVFADTAEWLFCLARDWLRGEMSRHWWWDPVRAQSLAGTWSVPRAWSDSAEFAPAAFALLARERLGPAFVRALPSVDVNHLTDAILSVFALGPLPTPPLGEEPRPQTDWLRFVPELRDAPGEPPRRLLLALGLLLARRPERPRRPEFLTELAAWVAGVDHSLEPRSRSQPATAFPDRPSPSDGLPACPRPWDGGAKSTSVDAPHVFSNGGPDESCSSETRTATTASAPPEIGMAVPESRARDLPGPADISPSTSGLQPEGEREVVEAPSPVRFGPAGSLPETSAPPSSTVAHGRPFALVAPQTGPFQAETSEEEASIPRGQPIARTTTQMIGRAVGNSVETVETRVGGVLYLVNVGISLGLYGDFTQPARPGIALSLWDFLDLLGRYWLGSEIDGDPLGPLLARLAGREDGEAPGAGVEPPRGWRPPDDWHAYARLTGTDPWRTLDEWLQWLAVVVEGRLVTALGLDSPNEVAPTLLWHRATVRVTPAYLDATFALDELPVAVRVAGLDRDPGWVPAAGRVVRFHFE